jgi:ketose-bisphosphate aldolases
MSLVTLQEILAEAVEKKYAVPALNGHDFFTAQGCILACEQENRPLILMYAEDFVFPSAFSRGVHLQMLLGMARSSSVPVCVMIDHAGSFDLIMRAIHYGVGGVMIDGSELPFEENVALTRKVVEAAHACGIGVEAEIGHVGGYEGTPDEGIAKPEFYTKPEEAERFVELTGVDALAIAFGSNHGPYQGTPQLDIARLGDIRQRVGNLPLVLHGGSGLPDNEFSKAVAGGINKVNYISGMLINCAEAMRSASRDNEGRRMTSRELFAPGLEAIVEETKHILKVFNTQELCV